MRLPNNIQSQFHVVEPSAKVETTGMTVVVTIHGENRLPQLYRCLDWILNQTLSPVEVIVVEYGPKKIAKIHNNPDFSGVRHLFIKNTGLFCKSACYNRGISYAAYENICGIDADLLMPSEFLIHGYNKLQTHDVCFMADNIYYMKGEMKNMFDFTFSGQTWQTHRGNWQFHGGSFFIKKQKYFDIGGHDESFKGHGSEDSEFYKRCHDTLNVGHDNHVLLHVEHVHNIADFVNVEINKTHLYNVQLQKLDDRIAQLKNTNKYLKPRSNNQPTTDIPSIIPNIDERLKKLRDLQAHHEQLNRMKSAPVINNDAERRRRRLLGYVR